MAKYLAVVPVGWESSLQDWFEVMTVGPWRNAVQILELPIRASFHQRQQALRDVRAWGGARGEGRGIVLAGELNWAVAPIAAQLSELGASLASAKGLRGVERRMRETFQEVRWLSSLSAELQEALSCKSADAEAWLGQFRQIGHVEVGKAILAQVRVVSTQEVARRILEAVGEAARDAVFAAFCDADPGDSSRALLNSVAQVVGSSSAWAVTGASGEIDALLDGYERAMGRRPSRVVLIEDAIWTGHQLLDRVEVLSYSLQGKQVPLATAAAFATAQGRQYFLSEAPNRIGWFERLFWAADPIVDGLSGDPDRNFALRYGAIGPTAEAVCSALGAQMASGRHEPLGFGSLGATLMFSHSIPDSCLPIIYKGGRVNFGGTSLGWRPLVLVPRKWSNKAV